MVRKVLTDSLWEQLEFILVSHGCRKTENNRNVMEAILWKLITGSPWRDVTEKFCPWKTAHNRFNRWAAKGFWDKFFLLYKKKLIQSGCLSTELTHTRSSAC